MEEDDSTNIREIMMSVTNTGDLSFTTHSLPSKKPTHYHQILNQLLAHPLASTALPDRLSDDEVFAVDVIMATAWIHNLTIVDPSPGSIRSAVDIPLARQIRYRVNHLWGHSLPADPSSEFAVHFDRKPLRPDDWYNVATLTLLSTEAVQQALENIFPTDDDDEEPDYMKLLVAAYQS